MVLLLHKIDMRGTQRRFVRPCVDRGRQEAKNQNSGREERWRCLSEGGVIY
jgi:hypothetical protein